MTLCNIHKTFKGSQDGRFSEDFEAGTQRDLSDYLLSCIEKDWATPVDAGAAVENKAVVTDGQQTGKIKRK